MQEIIPRINRNRVEIISLVVLGILIGKGEAIVAYDCSKPKLSGSYSLLAVKQCREADPDVIQIQKEELYLYESPTTQELSVRACKVLVAYYVSYCGSASHNSLIEFDQYPSPDIPTAGQCETYHNSRTMIMDGSSVTLMVNATVNFRTFKAGNIASDGTCEQGTFVHNGKTHLKVYAIASYSVTLFESKIVLSSLTKSGEYLQ